ncbi:hypothetical protein MOO46_07565 (plasmid) [Apilactobacillus apisilvae]|uniref:Phage protein n=1 Tax=Apilactobacillus apisilvae TaxID=2923364 RepID=A0ABY4PKL7_9LACO|nr:hypothetical protein [Apilactobacillus apisilvae]UQS85782.1 hypothetical protein MOO46_07565 [Apilactobacillus apisilvae]
MAEFESVANTVGRAIKEQLGKYKDIVVGQANVVRDKPKYPYITYNVTDPNLQIDFDPTADHFNLKIQVKAVTNDQRQYYNLLEYIRRLLFLQQPTADLARQGIGVLSYEELPATPSFVDNFIIFDGGYSFTLNAYHHEDDFTQPKYLNNANIQWRE